jgi:hypothetical protein
MSTNLSKIPKPVILRNFAQLELCLSMVADGWTGERTDKRDEDNRC